MVGSRGRTEKKYGREENNGKKVASKRKYGKGKG